MSIGLALSIANDSEIITKEKEKTLSNIEKEIEAISNMPLWEYLNHLKEKDKEKEDKDKINDEGPKTQILLWMK